MRTRTLGEGGPEVTVVGLGTNNFGGRIDLQQTHAVIDAALDEGITLFDTAKNHYSFIHRETEDEVLPTCVRLGIGMLPFFPLASGLLTGKYHRGEEPSEGRLAGREIPADQFDRLEALERFADDRGVSVLEVAIGGLAARPAAPPGVSRAAG